MQAASKVVYRYADQGKEVSKRYAIIDIDGTCSNAEKRKYLIDGSQKKDWQKFYDLCGEDLPHEDIKELVNLFHRNGLYICYLTVLLIIAIPITLCWHYWLKKFQEKHFLIFYVKKSFFH